ncbi:hypothetical protein [Singulisphaera acidiphila]|uniref:hypothetical protein n=1 Tax=Singulisphaera acidiphila TaxID=466153 RepID=UPI000247125B|nr:hypothetical protein [Singulisphaera acidiphila]
MCLLQVLHGNTACQHVVYFGNWSFTDSAYCQARKRLPLAVFHRLLEKIATTSRAATEGGSRSLGHRVWLVDGSRFSMPDEPELQRCFGQPGNPRKSCGFPVAKWLALFDLTTGMLLRSAAATPLPSAQKGGHRKSSSQVRSFFGLPRARRHDSNPKRSAVTRVHDSPPNGFPRSTECRRRFRSTAESGSFTRSNQRESRNGGLPRQSIPWPLNQGTRLDHRQSSARTTNSARNAFRST